MKINDVIIIKSCCYEFTNGSFTTIIPYKDHDNALPHIVKLVQKGNDDVDRSLRTVAIVANGDPINITAKQSPNKPTASLLLIKQNRNAKVTKPNDAIYKVDGISEIL
jgi:hypothetical protein